MRHLLVINPNTGQATTKHLFSQMQTLLPSDVALDCINARFGAPYIACEASHAVASHALLDAWAHHLHAVDHSPDGVVIACFVDPGLFALREVGSLCHRDGRRPLETYAGATCSWFGFCAPVAAY